MVKCEICEQDMQHCEGCSVSKIKLHGKIYKRIRVGAANDLSSDVPEGHRCRIGDFHMQIADCECEDMAFIIE